MSRSAILLLFVAVAYIALCKVEACGRNEQFNECPSRCELKCNEEPRACIEECGEPSCQCKLGYCRDERGECVSNKTA
ncbi:chymotrypsin inhibitor Ani s 6 [Lasioglossum baleicum]|uniref:chymotrypsin inhibitor Ani s 6 n=1 Tax=Lasioglossum baleicum TaxID=434251 RepID=UPI003FCC384B